MKLAQHILVPVDYSDHARVVVSYALGLAKQLGASVYVLHAWECEPHVSPHLTVHDAEGHARPLLEFVREQAEANMQQFLASISVPDGVALEQRLTRGAPARAIVDEAVSCGADLIVMGTHGRTGIAYMVLGSVAEKVVRQAPVPVLTVPERSTGS